MPSHTDTPSVDRVLVVAPTPFFGDRGCHVRIYEEVRGLQQRGLEVIVTTYPTGQNIDGLQIERSAALPGVRARPLGPSYGRPLLDLLLLKTTLGVARHFRPHIVHAHLHEGILIGSVLRRSIGAPLVADLQGSLTAELVDHRFIRDRGLAAGVVSRFERWLVRQPDAVVVSSAAGIPMLAAQGVDAGRIMSLPDGADLRHFHPEPPNAKLVDRFGLRGKQIVVFLGVLTAYQGVDALIDAIPTVVGAVPNAHFLIMGYPDEDRYRALIAARGLATSATLPGRVPYAEAARWLSLGALAVSAKTSLTESNGKLLNYMACGLPVVATDTPVNRELLGEAGVYVPVGDVGGLAAAIVGLLRAPERRRTLGAALRRRVEAQFAWPMLTDRLVDLYARLVQTGTRAA